MARRPSKQGLSTGILIILLAGVMVSQALQVSATHQPANKAAANGSHVVVVPAAPIGTDDPEGTLLMQNSIKTSGPTDLVFSVTAECSILTQVDNPGGPPPNTGNTETAEGRLRIWVTIDDKIVPIQSFSQNPQPHSPSSPGKDEDKVTFCNRFHQQQVQDRENAADGTDRLRTYIRTKNANAFNWIYLNAGSGVHTIEVHADLVTTPAQACAGGNNPQDPPQNMGTCANGMVGNRTLMVWPEKFPNDAIINETGE